MSEQMPGSGTRERTRAARWQPLAAAGAVVVLAGAAVAVGAVMSGRGTDAVAHPGGAAAPPPAARPATPLADLLVRDGDTVAAAGEVRALPGKPVRLCAPRAVADVGYLPGHEPLPAYCAEGVTLVGADLANLQDRHVRAGIVTGRAWIQGRYRAGTVTVTKQAPPPNLSPEPPSFPTATPCTAPSGGWVHTSDLPRLDALQRYIEAHPDQYGELVITYPDGPPTGPTDSPGYAATQVALVTTTIDPAEAYRELRTVYRSNLCVTRAVRARAAVTAVGQRLDPAIRRHPGGISSYSADFYAGRFTIEPDIVDEAWYGELTRADAGTGILDVRPWLLPVR